MCIRDSNNSEFDEGDYDFIAEQTMRKDPKLTLYEALLYANDPNSNTILSIPTISVECVHRKDKEDTRVFYCVLNDISFI